jgi:hypothetical protein
VWRYATGFRNILIDGDFEAGSGWDLPATVRPARYSDDLPFDGRQSMRIGIDAGTNALAYSSARQTVTVPISATFAQLSLRAYFASGESQSAAASRPLSTQAPAAGDAQYVLIIDPNTGSTLQTLLWTLSNAQAWQRYLFDLSPYAGQMIVLHFGVYNDGAGGRTAMYIDNAALVASGPLPKKAYLPIILKNAAP